MITSAAVELDPVEGENAVATAIRAGQAMAGSIDTDAEGVLVVVPAGARLQHFRTHKDRPTRKTGTTACQSLLSFKALVDRHKTPASIVYVDEDRGLITAVLDDHDPARPGWGDHRVVYACPVGLDWERWRAVNRKKILQMAFVEFLEDVRLSIWEPVSAELLELIRDLKGSSNATWRSGFDLANGAAKLEYVEEIEAKSTRPGSIELPAAITILCEVFRGCEPIEIRVWLRYSIDKGVLVFRPVIDGMERVEQQAMREMAAELAAYWAPPTKDGSGARVPLVLLAHAPEPRPYP